jgi:mannose-1-phosphate guanylyltransferase/mannose-1-phosphate guanylyltransferase/mannose-6-phosphate isomerase
MEDLPNYAKDVRPWGQFERFTLNEQTTVKIITVNAGEEFSLQTHEDRDEFWRVLSGYGVVTVGDKQHDASPGDEFFITRGDKHRAQGGEEGLVFLEIAFGVFDEDDIKRLEDKYGRASS